MSKLSTMSSIFPLLDEVTKRVAGAKTLEVAAQGAMSVLYEQFSDSIVLIRLFVTVPFGKLPDANRQFVTNLVKLHGIAHLLTNETPVLSLIGTQGCNPAWNDRRVSQGHIGIPLASATFIDRIPMMSRLLKEVGFQQQWIDRQEAVQTTTFAGGLAGVFYVQDAVSALDDQGRKIISAQEFVRDYAVKTVFGMAGGYINHKAFLTLITFCREQIQKSQAERYMPFISHFKAATTPLAAAGAIFA